METYGQELLWAPACKNTAKYTAPHMLALRQIAWLNQTGSQSAAFQLITVSFGLVRKSTTCYISTAQRKLVWDCLVLSKSRNEWWRMRFGGSGWGARVQARLSFLTRHSCPTCLPSLPAGGSEVDTLIAERDAANHTHHWKTWLVKSRIMETSHTCFIPDFLQNANEARKWQIPGQPKDFTCKKKRTNLMRESGF